MRSRFISAAGAVALTILASIAGVAAIAQGHGGPVKVRDVSLELVGQVLSSAPGVSPATSAQYGFVSQVGDRPTDLLTFYTDTITNRVVNNGPLRIVSRTGTVTIYHDPAANGDFANPDSFRDGTPVLSAVVRQQVILNTQTGAFTATNLNTITARAPFELAGETVLLGRVGGQFRTMINGQVATAALPSAFMAGFTMPATGR